MDNRTSEEASMADYAVKRIDEMEAVFAGAFKRARAELGVQSFGMQVLDMPANTDQYPEHDHAGDGQEEVYVALRGSGEVEIEGARHPLDVETMVRVSAGTKRKIWPGEEGLRVLAIGGCPGKTYEPPEATELGAPDPLVQRQA
jgi:mannose-6-phosphate isomerase-like protein (cupin superfamily)